MDLDRLLSLPWLKSSATDEPAHVPAVATGTAEPNTAPTRQVAFIFPGQGSQFVGMGRDLIAASPAARAVFARADEILGFSLSDLCFNGPAEILHDTVNAQPAILAVSMAYLAAFRERWEPRGITLQPRFLAGHSLGEYSALVAAGVLDLSMGLRLVRERGRLMKESGESQPGGMAAVIGLDDTVLEDVCREATEQGIVCPANYNSPGQTVISGELAGLSAAIELALQRGARRVIRLAVSIASHSPMMQRAAEQFTDVIGRFTLEDASVPIISDISARVLVSADEIRQELTRQLYSSVRWSEAVRQMMESGVTTFVEIGPGQVLTGLVRRIDRRAEAINVGDVSSLDAAISRLLTTPTAP